MKHINHSYKLAQEAIASLKVAIYILLSENSDGLKNSEIGRSLGIYTGHEGHAGHIPRTLLAMMETEEVVYQNPNTKVWKLKDLKSN